MVALAGSADSFNWLFETNGQHGTIYIPTGGSVSANLLFVGNYCADVINGNLSCGTAYVNNSTSGHQIFTGSGALTAGNWVSNHLGTIDLGTAVTMPPGLPQTFTGSISVSGTFIMGLFSLPGVGSSNGNGSIINQTGGSVLVSSSTADTVLMNADVSTTTYNLSGGTLAIPHVPVEMGWGTIGSSKATLNQTGGLANIYGLSMGTTQNLGAEPGSCAISVTGGTLNLGGGGIISGSNASKYSVTFGNATIGALAPWTASAPITATLNNSTTATFNTSGGNIVLALALSGGGGLTATGGGTLLLDNPNTYTGATTVSSGTLQLGDGVTNTGSLTSNIGTSGGAVVNFAIPSSSTVTYSNAMTGGGSLVTGPGTLVINGTNNNFSGGTTISGGTLQLGDGAE